MFLWSKSILPASLDGRTALRLKHIRLRLTKMGYHLAIVLVVLWALAVNYQVNLAYLLIFLLSSSMVCGALATLQQLNGLILEVMATENYFAGEPITLTIKALNAQQRKRWLWLYGEKENEISSDQQWQLWSIDTDHTTFHWHISPQSRGYLSALFLHCFSNAPFGLMRAEALWQYDGDIVVYPKPIQHIFPAAVAVATDHNTESSQVMLQGEDIAFLLPHRQGTSIRQIAWKQYAKNQQLLDKYFDGHQTTTESLTISYRDYPQVSNKERLAGLLCYRVLMAQQQNKRYILELPHHRFMPSPAQLTQCLNALGVW